MKYIVYITINSKNDKIYVGVHKTKTPNIFDGYIGCGCYINQPSTYMYPKTAFQYAVKKYGVDSFRRITLYYCDTLEESINKANGLLNNELLGKAYYNISKYCYLYDIYQYDESGKLLKKWDSLLDIADFYGEDYFVMLNVLTHGYLFKDFYLSLSDSYHYSDYNKSSVNIIYIYDIKGNLKYITLNENACNKYLGIKDVSNYIQSQSLINNSYYASYKLVDKFKPKARVNYMKKKFFVYKASGELVGVYIGKQIMKVINLHSWNKIRDILIYSKGWYKDYYISETEVEVLPNRNHSIVVEVFDKYGKYIETLSTIRELKDKYNVPSSKIKNIQKGNRYYKDYIFKYHSIHSK